MHTLSELPFEAALAGLNPETPVLIAGPTASGKSALALEIARRQGGVIVNADASQVYDCWRVITARPSAIEEAQAPHLLYGHIAATAPYSAGHWLREVAQCLKDQRRPILVGGTGLYFNALTAGLADIPATPAELRHEADALSLDVLRSDLDDRTAARLDLMNRRRVQRAWEVLRATGRSLADWQDDTGPPLLPLAQCHAIAVDAPRDWLNDRIQRRFELIMAQGALEEVRAQLPFYDPSLPAYRAIGVPELMAHLAGTQSLDKARDNAVIATRQYAKRQRTWMRRGTAGWQRFNPA